MNSLTLTLSPEAAAPLLARTHGIVLDRPPVPLGSELASTFRAVTAGRSIAVKMQASSASEFPVQTWRAAVAAHLTGLGLPVPEVIPALDGTLVGSTTHARDAVAITVSEWVDASPYGEIGAELDELAFARELGATAARLQCALETAPRPPRDVQHTWAAHTMHGAIADHLPRVADPEVRDVAHAGLALIDEHVAPLASALPRALVHQDLHDSNVLARPTGSIAAVIDFDDMLIGWRVAEPAIAAAYLARHAANPMLVVEALAEAWEEVVPFTPEERAAYPALVRARLALNATVWSVRQGGARDDYARMRSSGTTRTFEALEGFAAPVHP